MTARPIRRNAQTPDRNGKIFYTSTTSLSHISKLTHDETQQELGKRNYQKIIFALITGVITLIICFIVISIFQYSTN